eukprot:g1974.t1
MSGRRHQSQSSLGFLFGGGSSAPEAKVSANTFATGSNQNCGNFITGRSTTRVHAPPGGRSNISLFGGYGETETVKKTVPTKTATATKVEATAPTKKTTTVSSNKFACGSNQNCGNFITDRSTTRIHAPPGGRTQISIFGDRSSSFTRAEKKTKAPAPALKETSKTNVSAPPATTAPAVRKSRHTSSNAFATGSNQNCGNFITDRPTTRVRAPPGGRSQITFG